MNLHRFLMIALAAAAIMTLTACSVQATGTPELQAVVDGNTDFAYELYQELADDSGDDNFFFSPHSISVALAMTYAGAREETAEAMADTMHFTLPQETLHPSFQVLDDAITSREGLELFTANSLWGQQGYNFLPDFLNLLNASYGAGMNLVDFVGDSEGARVIINDWVYEETREKIEELIPPRGVDALTRLVLVNAIYFKADWLTQFDPEDTFDGSFRLLDGNRIDAKMMSMNAELPFLWTQDYSAIELPYSGEDLSMVIILPSTENFNEIESSLDKSMVDDIVDRMTETELAIILPKFEMESTFRLHDALSSMGMSVAFNFGEADFSGMDGTQDLFISDVFHKAYVLVNEEGTEAAAATAVVMTLGSASSPGFIADHPFIFLIRDRETGAILFMGRMMDPSTAQVSEESESE